MKIFGCGDLFITRRLPQIGYNGFDQIQDLIKAHDVCFGNMEVTVHNNEGYPSGTPGGGWAITSPDALTDLKNFGFNILNIGNNHTLDFSHNGLEATIKYLNAASIPYVGAGLNLTDASRPKYIECSDRSRAAVIGITSSFNVSDAAGPMGGTIKGRPGVNPLRRKEIYELTSELYKSLVDVVSAVKIKDTYKYPDSDASDDEGRIVFRGTTFVRGDTNRRNSTINTVDLNRMLASIKEANLQADCTIVSFHSHQMAGEYENPHEFIVDFCHKCIDAGANIIFGHGVHTMRGLEIYRGCPIFYGLGDFIFQNDMMEIQPYEFYSQLNIERQYLDCVGIAMKARSADETKGLNADPRTWESISTSVEFECGRVRRIKIYPITLGFEKGRIYRGWPELDKSGKILKHFSDISQRYYNTCIVCDGNVGHVEL